MRCSVLFTAVLAGCCAALFLTGIRPSAQAHCEIPCGIYTDHLRIEQMLEDTRTIEKAMGQIRELTEKTDALSVNQLSRWITNKEEHATRIQDTIARYYMHQRIKPVQRDRDGWDGYVTKLTEHHAVMVNAMTTKQSVTQKDVDTLRQSIQKIARYYPAEHDHDHSHIGKD